MKILIHKEKRQIVDGREHIVGDEMQYAVTDLARDQDTKYGRIAKEDLTKPSGSVILTKDTKKEFILLDADYIDIYKRLRKLPQTIPLKDIGLIIGETGINHESTVVDSGLGSGALAISLARIAKHVTSYEIREDHIAVSQENIKSIGLTNITVKHKSIYDGIDEKNVDLITFDLPEPWKAVPHASLSLAVGGWLVSYSPSIIQANDFAAEIQKDERFLLVKTVEIIERLWETEGRKVRPKSTGIGHSGFLTFVRKIKS
ncbi:methyltransferase domain-containing protein [Candidatus Woesearchaeota archaeon]|nr:MAG: methyltransferase domain-containing protein [Candidatus Woesearchaeota archaeon]